MSPRRPSEGPLVLFHGALGDMVLLTGMLQALAHRWGRPCDLVVGGGPADLVLRGLECVGRVELLGSRKTPYVLSPRQRRIVAWLSERAPGPCWVVERWRHPVSPRSDLTRLEWLLRRSGACRDDWVSRLDRPREPLEYAVAHQLRMAAIDPPRWRGSAARAMPDPAPATRLEVSPEEVADCRAWLAARGWSGGPLVLVQTRSRRPGKRGTWPVEKWLELTRLILGALPKGRVLLIGSPGEAKWARSLVAAAGDARVSEAASDLHLRRLFALVAQAHSCVSLDTLPAQAAIALGCPVAVLSGTGDPRRSLPLDRPGGVRIATAWPRSDWPEDPAIWFERHEMAEIPVATVWNAWRDLEPSVSDSTIS